VADADDDAGESPERGERIAKWLARSGVASRRDAEKLIAEGRVRLENTVVETPATFIRPGDLVTVDGKPVAAPQRSRLFRYNKPTGLVTTHRDEKGRDTVFQKLPPGLPRVVSVGRLDLNSEGLLLLTNDGELARRLELPANGWLRRYRVRVNGFVDERALAELARGVTVEGVRYAPIEAGLDSRKGANAWLTVALHEGKNREIRRVMQYLGLHVSRLIRTAYGPFQLGSLPRGAVEEVNPKVLRDQLGLKTETPAQERLRKVKAQGRAEARADRFSAGPEDIGFLGKVELTEVPPEAAPVDPKRSE
jgi:23S rRNA pseudouridine2605 synthase